jgi:mRNA interferase MazF
MAAHASWCPDHRDMIWIDCHPLMVLSPREFNERTEIVIGLPMTTASYNETNPFAVRRKGPRRGNSYILGHQAKSFD